MFTFLLSEHKKNAFEMHPKALQPSVIVSCDANFILHSIYISFFALYLSICLLHFRLQKHRLHAVSVKGKKGNFTKENEQWKYFKNTMMKMAPLRWSLFSPSRSASLSCFHLSGKECFQISHGNAATQFVWFSFVLPCAMNLDNGMSNGLRQEKKIQLDSEWYFHFWSQSKQTVYSSENFHTE